MPVPTMTVCEDKREKVTDTRQSPVKTRGRK